MLPSLEEFEQNLSNTEVEQSTGLVDPHTPFILNALKRVKNKKVVSLKQVCFLLMAGKVKTPKDEIYKITRAVMQYTLRMEIKDEFPTTFKMPAQLPTWADGRVVFPMTESHASMPQPEPTTTGHGFDSDEEEELVAFLNSNTEEQASA